MATKTKTILILPFLISLALILFGYAAAPASRPISSIFEISDQSNNLNFAAADYNSDGTYLVVWCYDGSTYKKIQGQAISKFGLLTGSMSDISPADAMRCKPDLAYSDMQSKYLVVYEWYDGVQRSNIRGLRFYPGNPPESEITLGTGAALRRRYNPAVAYSTQSDVWLAVWESNVQNALSTDIEGQFIHGSGVLSGTNKIIALGNNDFSYDQPDVAYNPYFDEFLVVWRRENKADAHTDILGKLVSAKGSVGANEIIIGWYTSDEENPAVAGVYTNAGGQYLVAWDLIYGTEPEVNHDIYAHIISGFGDPYVNDIYVATTLDNETKPAVATNGLNFLVSWTGEFYVLGFPFNGAFARPISYLGNLLFNQEWIGGFFVGETALSRGWNGDYLVAMDAYDLFGNWDIWGRLWGNRVDLPLIIR